MGKSQMLLAASQVASRSVYIGGNTSSTGGLTVTLTKEPGGEIGIEAGALVIADQGTACIGMTILIYPRKSKYHLTLFSIIACR